MVAVSLSSSLLRQIISPVKVGLGVRLEVSNLVALCMADGSCGGGWIEVASLASKAASTAAKRSSSKLIPSKKSSGTAFVVVVVVVV